MSVLVTPDEMRAAEAAAITAGRPEPDLMREAAEQITGWVDTHVARPAGRDRTAVAFVGPGNNGGDALVALALLVGRGWIARSIFLGREDAGELPVATDLLNQVDRADLAALSGADVILDGVYGVGGRASLPDEVANAFRHAHETRVRKSTPLVAIDVPSGVDPGSGAASADAFVADVTLCLGLPKIGLVREPAASHVGELVMLQIGIAPPPGDGRPTLIDESFVREKIPGRRASAHKHQTGTVMVIGGAPTYYGAPRLCAESAARAGAGLICVAIPAEIAPVIAGQVPELVLLPLDDSARRSATQIIDWIDRRGSNVQALVIGPGLGQEAPAVELLEHLLAAQDDGVAARFQEGKTPGIVLDADALNWIAKRGSFPAGVIPGSAVLTPHVGELARLMDLPAATMLADPIESAKNAAYRFEQTVIFKTGFSVAADRHGRVAVAPRSSPELATAGTGDVLAGLVGGLMAQGLEPFDAARVALYVGSHAGRAARTSLGLHGVLARDVIDAIPRIMRDLYEPLVVLGKWSEIRGEM